MIRFTFLKLYPGCCMENGWERSKNGSWEAIEEVVAVVPGVKYGSRDDQICLLETELIEFIKGLVVRGEAKRRIKDESQMVSFKQLGREWSLLLQWERATGLGMKEFNSSMLDIWHLKISTSEVTCWFKDSHTTWEKHDRWKISGKQVMRTLCFPVKDKLFAHW